MVQPLCDSDAPVFGQEESATTWQPTSAGGIRRIRSSASSPEGNKRVGTGQELSDVCRELEVTESTWHRWAAQYGGMEASNAKRLKELAQRTPGSRSWSPIRHSTSAWARRLQRETSDPELQAQRRGVDVGPGHQHRQCRRPRSLDRTALHIRFDNGPEFVAHAVDGWCRFSGHQLVVHQPRITLAERLARIVERAPTRRAAQLVALRLPTLSSGHHHPLVHGRYRTADSWCQNLGEAVY